MNLRYFKMIISKCAHRRTSKVVPQDAQRAVCIDPQHQEVLGRGRSRNPTPHPTPCMSNGPRLGCRWPPCHCYSSAAPHEQAPSPARPSRMGRIHTNLHWKEWPPHHWWRECMSGPFWASIHRCECSLLTQTEMPRAAPAWRFQGTGPWRWWGWRAGCCSGIPIQGRRSRGNENVNLWHLEMSMSEMKHALGITKSSSYVKLRCFEMYSDWDDKAIRCFVRFIKTWQYFSGILHTLDYCCYFECRWYLYIQNQQWMQRSTMSNKIWYYHVSFDIYWIILDSFIKNGFTVTYCL